MTNRKEKTMRMQQINRRPSRQHRDLLTEDPEPVRPVLRFSPTAWAKLLYFRDQSPDEVGGFGITDPDDLLFVKDFVTVRQEVTCVSVRFDDQAVGEFFDRQVDLGRKPEEFARVWLHTHPGDSPEPSSVDEETFRRVFGGCQWSVMFILAQDNSTYARLSFHVGPGGQVLIPAGVDYSEEFGPSDHEAWDAEYAAHVRPLDWSDPLPAEEERLVAAASADGILPYDFLQEFEKMDPAQRQVLLDELAERPDLWDQESEVLFI